MKRKRDPQSTITPDVHGCWTAGTVVMEGAALEASQEHLRNLRAKAVEVSHALDKAGIPHAVIGGLAVLAHVSRVDVAAERITRDMDLLLRNQDLDRAKVVFSKLGYRYRKVLGIPAFVQPKGRFRDGVHLIWSGEKVRPTDVYAAPNLADSEVVLSNEGYRCLDLKNLVAMKLTSFRLKDKVHIQDMMELGLITKKVRSALPPELLPRLKEVEDETERERLG